MIHKANSAAERCACHSKRKNMTPLGFPAARLGDDSDGASTFPVSQTSPDATSGAALVTPASIMTGGFVPLNSPALQIDSSTPLSSPPLTFDWHWLAISALGAIVLYNIIDGLPSSGPARKKR